MIMIMFVIIFQVNRHDPLPKTVCLSCIDKLESHTQMVQKYKKSESKFKSDKMSVGNSSSNDNGSDSTSDDENVIETHNSIDNSEINCQMPGCNLSVDRGPS